MLSIDHSMQDVKQAKQGIVVKIQLSWQCIQTWYLIVLYKYSEGLTFIIWSLNPNAGRQLEFILFLNAHVWTCTVQCFPFCLLSYI